MRDRLSTDIGLIWGWAATVPLGLGAARLWSALSERNRRRTLAVLAVTPTANVPAKTPMALDEAGVHLPDYTLHLAESY